MKGRIHGYQMLGEQKYHSVARPKLLRVIDAWDYLNDKAFDGWMVRPRILVWAQLEILSRGKKIHLLGAYDNQKNTIWLRYGEPDMVETLFHEMCHQFCWEVLGESHEKHGEIFKSVYRKGLEKLNKELKSV